MKRSFELDRRRFIANVGLAAVGLSCRSIAAPGCATDLAWLEDSRLDAWLESLLESEHVPGMSMAVIDRGKVLRTAAYGWADLAERRRMTTRTVINIASVTKTFTGTAVMQLWEADKIRLDGDVSDYLPFRVRNPAFHDVPITIRQLLTHNSSIADGPAYQDTYLCGDHPERAGAWLKDYFSVHGPDAGNFQPWRPGAQARYSNVGYALLGYVVECVAGVAFEDYCRRNIFDPLRMPLTRFSLAGMPPGQHATPYSYSESELPVSRKLRDPDWNPAWSSKPTNIPLCLYSFVTAADGLVRTNAEELARFLLAFINKGELEGRRVLQASTVKRILSDQNVRYAREDGDHSLDGHGLTWFRRHALGADPVWGHNGGDPGVCTHVAFRPSDGRGLVVLMNGSPDNQVRHRLSEAVFLNKPPGHPSC